MGETVTLEASEWTMDVRGDANDQSLGHRGAGNARYMAVGRVPPDIDVLGGIWRGYLKFPINTLPFDDIRVITGAYLAVTTRVKAVSEVSPGLEDRSLMPTGGDAKARVHRLITEPSWSANGDGYLPNPVPVPMPQARFADADFTGTTKEDWADGHSEGDISPARNARNLIRVTKLVAQLCPSSAADHPIHYEDVDRGAGRFRAGNPAHWDDTHAAYPNDGFVIKTPSETVDTKGYRFEIWSAHADVDPDYRPQLIVDYDLATGLPATPRLIEPKGFTPPDFMFRGTFPDWNADDPIVTVMYEVWQEGVLLDLWEVGWNVDWPLGEFAIPNIRQAIPVDVDLRWRARTTSAAFYQSPYSAWADFRVKRQSPVVTPVPLGERSTMLGVRLAADWTV